MSPASIVPGAIHCASAVSVRRQSILAQIALWLGKPWLVSVRDISHATEFCMSGKRAIPQHNRNPRAEVVNDAGVPGDRPPALASQIQGNRRWVREVEVVCAYRKRVLARSLDSRIKNDGRGSCARFERCRKSNGMFATQIDRVGATRKSCQRCVRVAIRDSVLSLRHSGAEVPTRIDGRHKQGMRRLIEQFNSASTRGGIDHSAHNRWTGEVPHQPDPFARRLSPYFLVGPADLVGPIRHIGGSFRLNSHRNRPNHLAGPDAVQRGPVIAFAVHDAGRERIPADQPLGLLLREILIAEIPAQLCRD